MVGAFYMLGRYRDFLYNFLRRYQPIANRIKGITVEIGGDTTKLQTTLKGVNGQIKNLTYGQLLWNLFLNHIDFYLI